MKYVSRTVWILSLISLLTDAASEMLYPVMPLFLKSIGFSVLLIGILEGIAEAVTGLSKGYFGRMSDLSGRRVIFVRAGYFLSAVSKPLMAVLTYPLWIFFARSMDRLGKGVRTAARDAMLSEHSTAGTKARVFGLHRSMDTAGAVIGPVFALVYLHFNPGMYKPLFLIAFLPGMAAVALSFFLKDERQTGSPAIVRYPSSFLSFIRYWNRSPAEYRRLTAGLLFFALFNSSDIFLLLKVSGSGMDDTRMLSAYIFYNLVYALFSFPAGMLADKIGLKKVFIAGLLLFAFVYAGMAVFEHTIVFYILFFVYGLYAASTEGIAKAWIALLSKGEDTATAIGAYSAFQSLCTLCASSLTGIIWFYFGSVAAFTVIALAALITAIYFLTLKEPAEGK